MSGKKGQHRLRQDTSTARQKAWNSMRILRKFTVADLLRTVPGASYTNMLKFINALVCHRIAVKAPGFVSGRAGQQQAYRLIKLNNNPIYPQFCPDCGEFVTSKICNSLNQEKEKEREEEKETQKEASHDPA